MSQPPKDYTTKIPAKRTAAECVELLSDHDAHAVAIQLEARQPVGLSFTLDTPYGRRDFAMKVNIDGVHKLLRDLNGTRRLAAPSGKSSAIYETREQAAMVAWRQVRDWLAAQLALVQADMVKLDQVMIPYLMIEPGVTVLDRWDSGQLAIEGAR